MCVTVEGLQELPLVAEFQVPAVESTRYPTTFCSVLELNVIFTVSPSLYVPVDESDVSVNVLLVADEPLPPEYDPIVCGNTLLA